MALTNVCHMAYYTIITRRTKLNPNPAETPDEGDAGYAGRRDVRLTQRKRARVLRTPPPAMNHP
jgi:hypothetical protein